MGHSHSASLTYLAPGGGRVPRQASNYSTPLFHQQAPITINLVGWTTDSILSLRAGTKRGSGSPRGEACALTHTIYPEFEPELIRAFNLMGKWQVCV